jgi:hypothetical protein
VQEFLVVHEEIACQYTLEAQLLKQIAGGHGHLTKGILWIVALFGTSLAPPPTALKSSKSARNLERRSISNPTSPGRLPFATYCETQFDSCQAKIISIL